MRRREPSAVPRHDEQQRRPPRPQAPTSSRRRTARRGRAPIATQTTALTARRVSRGRARASAHAGARPRRAPPTTREIAPRRRARQAPSGVRSPSRPSGRKTRMRMRIAKTIDCVQSLPGECHVQALVERLDEADAERAEHGAGQVADPAEHGRGERDQPELEAGVVAHLPEVEGVERARRRRRARRRSGT